MKAFFKEVADTIRDRKNWPDLAVGTCVVLVVFTVVIIGTQLLHSIFGGALGVWIGLAFQTVAAFFVTAVAIGPASDDPTNGTNGWTL